ncbi:MAG TPA: SAM-dependent chlorinase/fluorinase [Thermoanaerobaculia bacterium]|nr:SAM-dependent chlorinase/fluorinase [Thermoanaerobaculia bacterium]
MAGILTLLTDFGLGDYYVGAVKGTVLRLAPGTQLVDLSHEVPAGDVEAAADLLAGAAPAFPAGTVHLAVVDPGVGSARRLLVVQSGGQQFVAPDNGLLTAQLRAGGEAWSVTQTDLFLDQADGHGGGATFHGRDRFAPIAAALLRGDHPNTLGEAIDDAVRLVLPEPRRESTAGGVVLHGRVVRVDRFGNLVTDLPAAWLDDAAAATSWIAHVGSDAGGVGPVALRRVRFYEELPPGEPGVLTGSLGTLELSLRGESLAARWGVGRGAAVRIEPR